jgi:4-hydroxyphenylpyruvate dioxygenase
VADLREVADLGLQQNPPIRFVYESLAWGTRVDTWEACWDAVMRVDRANFGICLDTFNIAGRVYADPAHETGRTEHAEEAIAATIQRLKATIDVRKVFYVQVVDAERLAQPLLEGHEFYNAEQPCRMSWSRNCRLFYGEHNRGAYLPAQAIAHAIFEDLGFEGWVSMEYFNRDMADPEPGMPNQLARRAAASWNTLAKDMNWTRSPMDDVRLLASL